MYTPRAMMMLEPQQQLPQRQPSLSAFPTSEEAAALPPPAHRIDVFASATGTALRVTIYLPRSWLPRASLQAALGLRSNELTMGPVSDVCGALRVRLPQYVDASSGNALLRHASRVLVVTALVAGGANAARGCWSRPSSREQKQLLPSELLARQADKMAQMQADKVAQMQAKAASNLSASQQRADEAAHAFHKRTGEAVREPPLRYFGLPSNRSTADVLAAAAQRRKDAATHLSQLSAT